MKEQIVMPGENLNGHMPSRKDERRAKLRRYAQKAKQFAIDHADDAVVFIGVAIPTFIAFNYRNKMKEAQRNWTELSDFKEVLENTIVEYGVVKIRHEDSHFYVEKFEDQPDENAGE